ncbi:MAG: SDR family oxidoreductase [Rhodobacteraceae bacterium]|uniref:SDR family oxidoreductase n=1 Tax=Amaricoccus sp. TaxID=1872485 RepID=UPI001D4104C5|nr:SDR family oxidoreductase [Amaricoccus sp.]MCB1375453.1 SDR family oxidoreductase [Paracoccaceae bacterium]MCB1403067.1 SDR family oxidoreductase [Paracoccaceae bacterium]MCC0066601.1 SDR family oxidoreductase [Rhodovulum sp.]HRW16735.1 SDR family oxidoreductase [Amaricoccus sp.]
MADLSGLTALITGAGGGIGAAMAETFAAAGARLALVDIVDCGGLAARLGEGHRSDLLDLLDPEAIARTVAAIGRDRGIDILINNAGLGIVAPAEEQSVADWDRTHAINLRAPWLTAVAALPFLKASGRGRVVNIASQAAVIAIAEHAAYGSSKAGLIGLTKVLALEWARHGITVNAISPTVVETPMALVGWSGEKGVRMRQEIPVGRFARPGEIAAAALYLASEAAGIVNGENLMADGGYSIR